MELMTSADIGDFVMTMTGLVEKMITSPGARVGNSWDNFYIEGRNNLNPFIAPRRNQPKGASSRPHGAGPDKEGSGCSRTKGLNGSIRRRPASGGPSGVRLADVRLQTEVSSNEDYAWQQVAHRRWLDAAVIQVYPPRLKPPA